MPSAEYQRNRKAKLMAQDPNWLENERERWRRVKQERRADPVRGDQLREVEAARHRKRLASDPEYRDRRKKQDKQRQEALRQQDPDIFNRRRREKMALLSPAELEVEKAKRRPKDEVEHKKRMTHSRDYYKKQKQESPEQLRKYTLARCCKIAGITIENYYQMVEAQNGLCAICNGVCKKNSRLCIDHDHTTGEVRGLLCDRCNRGLGKFRDNPRLLDNAIKYLAFPPNANLSRKPKAA